MAVYQAGLDSRGRYVDGRVQWLNDTKEILRQTAAENFDPIYQMAENGVEKAMQNDTVGAAIQVMYQLKNGRQVFRNYKIQPEVYKTQENRLFADSDYVENLYALYRAGEAMFAGTFYIIWIFWDRAYECQPGESSDGGLQAGAAGRWIMTRLPGEDPPGPDQFLLFIRGVLQCR